MPDNGEHAHADESRFLQLVTMFQFAAMQQMGKIANPVTNEIERNLAQARASIDLLEMLQRKTEGNRTESEEQLLKKVLFELQMNYVDESRKPDEQADGDGEGGERTPQGEK